VLAPMAMMMPMARPLAKTPVPAPMPADGSSAHALFRLLPAPSPPFPSNPGAELEEPGAFTSDGGSGGPGTGLAGKRSTIP
jgi:hypothetical protein